MIAERTVCLAADLSVLYKPTGNTTPGDIIWLCTDLVVILHELYNDPYVVRVVFYRNDPHDVCGVFGVRVLAVFVRQHQTGVGFVDL